MKGLVLQEAPLVWFMASAENGFDAVYGPASWQFTGYRRRHSVWRAIESGVLKANGI
jgi:hypothetical protein